MNNSSSSSSSTSYRSASSSRSATIKNQKAAHGRALAQLTRKRTQKQKESTLLTEDSSNGIIMDVVDNTNEYATNDAYEEYFVPHSTEDNEEGGVAKVVNNAPDYSYHKDFNILDHIGRIGRPKETKKWTHEADKDDSWLVDKVVFGEQTLKFWASLPTDALRNQFYQYLKVIIPKCNVDDLSMEHDENVLSFDCCDCNNMVFVGCDMFKDKCSRCSQYRWKPCSRCGLVGTCSHSTRTPIKSISYRPLISIFKELVKYESFQKAIHYCHDSCHGISDIMNSPVALRHMQEMREFHSARSDPYQSVTPMFLLLQQGYDGAQVFKSKTSKFYPVINGIINLPPSFRKILGVGMFVVSIFTGSEGSACEKFLFVDCLIRELEELNKGVLMKSHNGEDIILYARLISHCYDTKALEKIVKCRSVMSKNIGCFCCRGVFGTRSQQLKHVVFEGDRNRLPLNHFLRSKGQGQQCCPFFYYYGDDANGSDGHCSLGENITTDSHSIADNRNFYNKLHSCELNQSENEEIKGMLRSGKAFAWFHDRISIAAFSEYIYYTHCDYRRYKPYSRVSNQEYLQNGRAGAELNRVKTTQDLLDVKGLYNVWYFSTLPYADISSQICWDPFHVLKGISVSMMKMLCNTGKQYKKEIVSFAKDTRTHPYLYREKKSFGISSANLVVDADIIHPWILSKDCLSKLDKSFETILYPSGYSNFAKLTKPFSNSGMLKGVPIIHLFTNLMSFVILEIVRINPYYPVVYLAFLLILSDDFCSLQQPLYLSGEIDRMCNKVNELVSLHSGLFPLIEATFLWHELVDVAEGIKLFGPINGWWTLPAERVISNLKKWMPEGGSSYYHTVLKRHLLHNKLKSKEFFSQSFDDDSSSKFSINNIMDAKGFMGFQKCPRRAILHSDHFMKLKSLKQHPDFIRFNETEIDNLLYIILREIWKSVDGDLIIALTKSRLCRLFIAYQIFLRDHKSEKLELVGFLEYLQGLEGSRAAFIKKNLLAVCNPSDFNGNDILEYVSKGGVFNEDINNLAKIFSSTEDTSLNCVRIFEIGFIYGMQFKARGEAFCERNPLQPIIEEKKGGYGHQKGKNHYCPSYPANRLDRESNLHGTKQKSSWFLFKWLPTRYPLSFDITGINSNVKNRIDDKLETKTYAGQFNYFFRLQLNSEPLVHNVPIASAVCRNLVYRYLKVPTKHNDEENPYLDNLYVVRTTQSFDYSLLFYPSTAIKSQRYESNSKELVSFVPLTDVFSNPLAISPIDCADVPVNCADNATRDVTITNLYLIGLYPSRMCITYSKDKTRIYNDCSNDIMRNCSDEISDDVCIDSDDGDELSSSSEEEEEDQ